MLHITVDSYTINVLTNYQTSHNLRGIYAPTMRVTKCTPHTARNEHRIQHEMRTANWQCSAKTKYIDLPRLHTETSPDLPIQILRTCIDLMVSGFFRTPGFFRISVMAWCVCFKMWAGARSIFVTTKNIGTLRARATPKCSLHMPTTPAKTKVVS